MYIFIYTYIIYRPLCVCVCVCICICMEGMNVRVYDVLPKLHTFTQRRRGKCGRLYSGFTFSYLEEPLISDNKSYFITVN